MFCLYYSMYCVLRIWVLMSILNVKLSEKRALEIGMMSGNSMSCVCCYNKLCATEQNAVFFFISEIDK